MHALALFTGSGVKSCVPRCQCPSGQYMSVSQNKCVSRVHHHHGGGYQEIAAIIQGENIHVHGNGRCYTTIKQLSLILIVIILVCRYCRNGSPCLSDEG